MVLHLICLNPSAILKCISYYFISSVTCRSSHATGNTVPFPILSRSVLLLAPSICEYIPHSTVAAWRSDSGTGCINKVTLRSAWLVLRWVTYSFPGFTISVCNHPPRPTQPPTLSGMKNEYQPKCCEAVWQGSNGRCSSFHSWINMRMASKSV